MGFQVSPGVNTSEIDLTTIVPGISSIDAGFAGCFRWGPVNDVKLIDSEDLLVETFQSPDANTYISFLTENITKTMEENPNLMIIQFK